MKRIVKPLAVLLMIVMLACPLSIFSQAEHILKIKAPAILSGNQAKDIVSVARANLDKTGSQVGATEHWCAEFVYSCARKAHIDSSIIPSEGTVGSLRSALLRKGANVVRTPKPGDLVFFGSRHVALMTGGVNSIHGNLRGPTGSSGARWWNNSKVVECDYRKLPEYKKYGVTFIRPNYKVAKPKLTVSFDADADELKISLSETDFKYNGEAQKPKVTIKSSDGKLIKKSNYKLTYSKGCKAVGVYSVTIDFKGRYSGRATFEFRILPNRPIVEVTSPAKKTAMLSWDKIKGATSYTVYCSNKRDGTFEKLGVTKSTKFTCKDLSRGKNYFFKVVANKRIDSDVKVSSAQSVIKGVKVR